MYTIIHLLPLFDDWTLLALRLVVGAILIAHGRMKLKNLPATIQWFGNEGFRPGWFWARFVMILEIIGGAGIFAGYLTQLFAVLFAGEFVVILLWRFLRRASFIGGYELDLLLLAATLVLLTVGGGYFTIGQILFGG